MSTWDKPLETGLRDDYDATIVAARFTTDARYMSGARTVLLFNLEGTDHDGAAFTDERFISIGDNWESPDGGQSVRHTSGKDRNFQARSLYGLIIQRAVSEFGLGGLLSARGSQYEARVWVGLRFHWKQEEIDYGSGIEKKQHLLPTAFLGETTSVPGAPAQAAVPTQAQAQAPVAAPVQVAAPAPVQANGYAAAALALAKALKAAGKSPADFLDAAMAIEGLTSDAVVLTSVVDGSLFASA